MKNVGIINNNFIHTHELNLNYLWRREIKADGGKKQVFNIAGRTKFVL